ncbi:FAD-binding oxidoreductase [Paenibacillus sp. PDC88]|uniref:NAD(P)/FAD-dependent oxidoreductase n=1 Tax=Paenibacillus sp. PDC88 TaxID=1884375 RepID=UPI0008991204|nr:FAD-dependent oxidoreductase [Paenibacillus sp. PDC88]SDW87093.1 Glycine/D-amino acid oxidase [Paenibacillus sp. PDC88]
MDLQTGKLYWPATVSSPPIYPPLTEDIQCDALIIGGGSSGAQSAYQLARQGLHVVVVDKRTIGGGSSSTNTALIQYAGDKMLTELAADFGEEKASAHLKLCRQAIDDIEQACSQLPDAADFVRRDSLYYASSEADVPALKQEHALLKKHGFDVDLWDENQIAAKYPFRKSGALYYRNDAEMNPLKYIYGLFEEVRGMGGKVYGGTEITGKKFSSDEAVFYTKSGHQIRTKYVIMAAGYEQMELTPNANATITSSYVVITKPVADLSSWYKRTLLWETARPYMYMRTTPDDRIIVGGMDQETHRSVSRDAHIESGRDQLMKNLSEMFPEIKTEPDYVLGAFFAGTLDGLPMIGRSDEYPNCYHIMAYGDNGTVYNMTLSRIVTDMITKGSSPHLDLYLRSKPPRKQAQ